MTLKKKTRQNISDRELSRVLAGLRENVAAPADFRAKLMQRLEREGVLASAPTAPVSAPGAWARLAAFFTPVRLGLAASAALALVLALRFTPAPEAVAPVPAAAVATSPAVVQAPVAAPRAKPASRGAILAGAPKAPATLEAYLGEPQTQAMPEAVGDQAAAAPGTTVQVSDVDPKPTVVVVEPSPTPMTQPLDGNSELRGNVVRASQGEAAVLIYRVLKAGRVHIELYDRLGRSVAVLRDAEQGPGVYDLRWAGGSDNGGLAASGIYVIQLQAPGYQVQHKLLLVK